MTGVPFAATDAALESTVGRHVPAEDIAEVSRQARSFTYGHCGVLAGRLHSLRGWGIVFLSDGGGDRPLPVHYCVRSPRGLVDAFGLCPRGLDYLVAIRHGVSSPVWKVAAGDAGLTDISASDIASVDAFLDSPWMQAVLAAAS